MSNNKQYRITTDTLKPLLNMSVGFDRLMEDFLNDPLYGGNSSGYPPFNINKISKTGEEDAEYEIVLALAGFTDDDIEIKVEDNNMKITGRSSILSEGEEIESLHKGIAERSFVRVFKLAEHVEVKSATLENGILRVRLYREIPEAKRPKLIAVNSK